MTLKCPGPRVLRKTATVRPIVRERIVPSFRNCSNSDVLGGRINRHAISPTTLLVRVARTWSVALVVGVSKRSAIDELFSAEALREAF